LIWIYLLNSFYLLIQLAQRTDRPNSALMAVSTAASDSFMNDLLRIKQDWEDLAYMDGVSFAKPHRTGRPWSLDEFFADGRKNLADDLQLLANAKIVVDQGAALDFGCGPGRVTQALATMFSPCYGVDLSAEMVNLAEEHNAHGERCRYLVNSREDLQIFENGAFAFAYSNNVLQHVPPPIIERYISELIRVLIPRGVLLLQMPIGSTLTDDRSARLRKLPRYHPARVWNKIRSMVFADEARWYYRLKRFGLGARPMYALGLRPRIEMFCVEESRLIGLAQEHGCSTTKLIAYQYGDMVHAKFAIVKGSRSTELAT
jgi:SAM-dependent methyltransferase